MIVKAYKVKNCKVSNKELFSGYVLNVDDENIVKSIKRKLGVESLLCEITNEGFDYDKVNIYSVPMTEMTLGDFMLINGDKSILGS